MLSKDTKVKMTCEEPVISCCRFDAVHEACCSCSDCNLRSKKRPESLDPHFDHMPKGLYKMVPWHHRQKTLGCLMTSKFKVIVQPETTKQKSSKGQRCGKCGLWNSRCIADDTYSNMWCPLSAGRLITLQVVYTGTQVKWSSWIFKKKYQMRWSSCKSNLQFPRSSL